MAVEYVGTRWHKCDLHLHTPASKCFKDKSVTPEQWVQEALDKGLSCVAVTDHNTGEWIDPVKEAAEGTGLTVFPGVEITCSDAKVHLLVLFDKDKTGQDVSDFLVKADINRKDFGEQNAHTNWSIEQVAELADRMGALVIPAHIDEFNGICQVGHSILVDFLQLPCINAVQVVHKAFWEDSLEDVKQILREYYGFEIDNDKLKSWSKAVKESLRLKKAILTFSDNPHEPGESKHGLWGMGRRFTWIKMEAEPSLEGLRQAFLSDDFRIRNDFECPEGTLPYKLPDQWLRKIVVKNTEVTHAENPLEVEFSPQLTTIIGGRGSGKSTILRFIRGLFQSKIDELGRLGNESFVFKDFGNFFRKAEGGVEGGVLKSDSVIDLYFQRHGSEYKIQFAQNGRGGGKRSVFRFNPETSDYDLDESEGLINLFEFDIFSQKQIYDIGSKTNSLRDRIDSEVPEIAQIKNQLEEIRNSYYEKSTELRSVESKVEKKPKLITEIKDLEERQNNLFKRNQLLKERERYNSQEKAITTFFTKAKKNQESLDDFLEGFIIPEIELSDELADPRIEAISKSGKERLEQFLADMREKKEALNLIIEHFSQQIAASEWQREKETAQKKYEDAKSELEREGLSLADIDRVSNDLKQKQARLAELEAEESKLENLRTQKQALKVRYFKVREELTAKRKEFLDKLLQNSNVKAKVNAYRDFDDFEQQFRGILRNTSYSSDFDKIRKSIARGNAMENCNALIRKIYEFRRTEDRGLFDTEDKRFLGLFKSLEGQQLDDLDLLAPEDEIQIEYKPNKASAYKPISNLSPGQKTASILTILLSHKKTPLILDQPEDDLDSFLIYDLIVDQLKKSKEFRQVIVVSHNANVPVNGDSEHIIIMNSESKVVEKLEEGSIDKNEVKEFVLQVMEGGKDAFDYRSKRYKIF